MIVCFGFFLSHTHLYPSVLEFCLGSKQKCSDFRKSAPEVQKEQSKESAAVRWIASGNAQLNNRNWYACCKKYCSLVFYLLLFTGTFSCPFWIRFRGTACSAFKPFFTNQRWSRTLKGKLTSNSFFKDDLDLHLVFKLTQDSACGHTISAAWKDSLNC